MLLTAFQIACEGGDQMRRTESGSCLRRPFIGRPLQNLRKLAKLIPPRAPVIA